MYYIISLNFIVKKGLYLRKGFRKMGHSCWNESHLEKWVTFGKCGQNRKNGSHIRKYGSHLETSTWDNLRYCRNRGRIWHAHAWIWILSSSVQLDILRVDAQWTSEICIELKTGRWNSYPCTSMHVISVYFINLLITRFLTIFFRFPTTFRRFSKFFQNYSEG